VTIDVRRGGRYLLTAASAVVVIAGLRAAAPLVLPVLLAGFLTILSLPLLHWLRQRRAPVVVAVLATVLAVVAVLTVFGLLISVALADVGAAAPEYLEQLQQRAARARDSLRESPLAELVSTEQLDPASALDVVVRTFGGLIRGTVVGVASLLSFVILVMLALVFMLAEACSFRGKLEVIRRSHHLDFIHFGQISREIQHYLGIKTLVSLATGALIFLWTWLAGVDFPLFWALIAFVLNFIPTIGSIIAGAPAVLVAFVQDGLGLAGVVLLGYLLVNLALGNMVEPRMMGLRFRLSTLVVFLSLLFWGFVWGPLGMLLSVPLTRSILIVLEHTGDFHWITVLLGRAR
jgi:predicted PurR-regulated permease PerM